MSSQGQVGSEVNVSHLQMQEIRAAQVQGLPWLIGNGTQASFLWQLPHLSQAQEREGSTGHPDSHLTPSRLGSLQSASTALVTLFRETHRRGPAVSGSQLVIRGEERQFRILPPVRGPGRVTKDRRPQLLLSSPRVQATGPRGRSVPAAHWGTKTLKGQGGDRRES